MFAVVLVHPEIPPNTGNVIRLTAHTATELPLVNRYLTSMKYIIIMHTLSLEKPSYEGGCSRTGPGDYP